MVNIKIGLNVQCYHCGDTVKTNKYTIEEDGATKYFCCNGCLNAYKFINQLNLDVYYKNREDFSEKPDELFDLSLFEYVDNKIPINYKDNIKFKEKSFHIQGLHCASCVWLNENVLSKLDGVLEVNVNFSNNRIYLKWNPEKISLKEIAENVHRIGYKLQLVEEGNENIFKSISEVLLKKMAVAGFFTGNNMLISAALYAGYFDVMDPNIKQFFHYFSFLFATPVYFYSASEFFRNSYYSLRNKIISMDILTSVGISLAYFYSIWITFTNQIHREVFFDAICFVVFAILIGRFIESRLKLKTYYFTTNLGSLIPSIIRKLKKYDDNNLNNIEENYVYTDIDEVKVGDIILVYPNEIIPLDSQLLNDKIEVDEASITGENLPITKQKNDFITSGSKNLSSEILLLKVLKNKENSTISQILAMSEESIKDKSKTETITHKVASIFIVFVLFLGFLTFGYWYFIKNQLSEAIINTLSILIVACPCALSLSVPTAIIVGVQKLFSHGVLFKNSSIIETLAKTQTLAFDKTGTLTKGNLESEKIFTFISPQILRNILHQINEHQRQMLLQHPITSAFFKIEQSFETQNIQYQNHKFNDHINNYFNSITLTKAHYLPGKGLMFEINHNSLNQGNYIFLGSKEFLENQSLDINNDQLNCIGYIEIYLGIKLNNEIKIIAMFILKDAIREEAFKLFEKINKKHHTILLTGDKKENALWLQNQLKIKEIYYELKPEDKAKIIKRYQTKNPIIMIGDGINDSIALKQANVGLSFAEASKLALYSSDILLLNYDLDLIEYILKYSRAILIKIKQNLVLSFFYNVLLLPLAFLGMLNPFVGSIFMSLSSVTVVSNSLTLLKYKNDVKM